VQKEWPGEGGVSECGEPSELAEPRTWSRKKFTWVGV
jgi:hypothetical protein